MNRYYTFSELAKLYFPNKSKRNASNQLRINIKKNKSLMQELIFLGYVPNLRNYSPRMVTCIFKYLDTPITLDIDNKPGNQRF